MMRFGITHSFVALSLGLCIAVTGCTKKNTAEPALASASAETGYATRFPGELSAARGELTQREADAAQLSRDFSGYPAALDAPADRTLEVYRRADAEGASASYVTELEESATVASFFDEERDELGKKVVWAGDNAAKDKGCDKSGAGSAAMSALDKAVEERLEKRLRARSEAHAYIAENEDAIGKKNVPTLEKQADEIARASYLVKVGLPRTRVRLERLVAEAKDVRRTLERSAKEAEATLSDAGRGEADKKAAQAKLDAIKTAQGALDGEISQAEHALQEIEQRVKTAQDTYQAAFDELEKATEEKAKAAKSAS
jgi:hypothetical protein